MNVFGRSKKKLMITDADPSYKVKYLGNVATQMMKGDGCVDKPIDILWTNYLKRPSPPIDMKLVINASGLKVYTKEQGLTQYSAHRISYCTTHSSYPRLFVWVYRHEGKKMKVELRCHAALCHSDNKARDVVTQLNQKIQTALTEFMREKTRNQNARLNIKRTMSLGGQIECAGTVPLRKKLLSPGQNYRPPVNRSASAPKLLAICEDREDEEEYFEDFNLDPPREEDEENYDKQSLENFATIGAEAIDENNFAKFSIADDEEDDTLEELRDTKKEYDGSDEDGESSESGFSEPRK